MARKPSSPTGGMLKDRAETFTMNYKRQVTHKLSGATDLREMENGLIGTCDMQVIGSHRSDGDGPSGPTGRMEMENGPTGTRHT